MHKTIAQTQAFLQDFLREDTTWNSDVVICGPFTTLATLQTILCSNDAGIEFGAQNMHWEESGAFTGEISAPMLQELRCRYVIIGHSERRRDCLETDETVNKKVQAALSHNLIPIICVGETLEQRQAEQTEDVVTRQVTAALADCDKQQPYVIAYEPIWAIGTGLAATPEQAQVVHALIRSLTTPTTSILYGGSVTPANSASLMQQPDINGALVGGASLNPNDFRKIITTEV